MNTCRAISHMLQAVYLFVIIFLITTVCTQARAYEVILGTVGAESFSGFAAKKLCHIITRYGDDITCKTQVINDSVDILTNLQNGSLDLALVGSRLLHDAYYKESFFRYTDINYNNLRLLLPLYRQPVTFVVRSDSEIYVLDDLTGKRVNSGAPASMKHRIFQEIMQAKGWDKKSFKLYQNLPAANSQDYLAFRNGSVQAMIHFGTHPDDKVARELAVSRARIVAVNDSDIAKMVEKNIGFCNCGIGPGVYTENTLLEKTLAVETLLLTSAETDYETVDEILKSIFKGKESLQKAHPSFLADKVKVEYLNRSYLHPHPQATMFFQENINRL